MAEIPCCFVAADSQCALNLQSGDSFLRFADQEGCHEPSSQRQVRIIEHGARRGAEHVHADGAAHQVLFGIKLFDFIALTTRAFRASGPAEALEKRAALFIGRELSIKVFKVHRHEGVSSEKREARAA